MTTIITIVILATQLAQAPQAYEEHVQSVAQYTARHDAAHAPLYVPPPPQPVAGFGKWEPILQCESNGDWYISTGTFEGGLQFHPGTWDAYKPEGYPDAAYQATPTQQVLVAERVLKSQGWKAWPVCSRKAGYR